MAESVEDIQRRCRSVAERLEALAGSPNDLVASANPDQGLLLEAASLVRGYHQCLLVDAILEHTRCDGRYPVPHRRDEPFDVTYRCALTRGHQGPHGNGG